MTSIQCVPVNSGYLPPYTRLRMADGSERRIDGIRLLDRVITADASVAQVITLTVRDSIGGLINPKIRGHSHLRLTSGHQVLTERGYVPVENLVRGDYVGFTRYLPTHSRTSVTTAEYLPPNAKLLKANKRVFYAGLPGRASFSGIANPIPSCIALTPGFGRIIGLFLAEGACDGGKVKWTFSTTETDTLVAELVALLKQEVGVDAYAQIRPNNSTNVVMYGTAWQYVFHALCGTGAGLKKLHPHLCEGPVGFLEAVLSGWMDGDGWRDKLSSGAWSERKDCAITISDELALAMYDIAQALGYRPSLQRSLPVMNRYAATRQPRWNMKVSFNDLVQQSHQTAGHVWRRLNLLAKDSYEGPVYQIGLNYGHSFVAEGVAVSS